MLVKEAVVGAAELVLHGAATGGHVALREEPRGDGEQRAESVRLLGRGGARPPPPAGLDEASLEG